MIARLMYARWVQGRMGPGSLPGNLTIIFVIVAVIVAEHSFERQFDMCQLDIVSVQEARIAGDQIAKGMHYTMYIAGADANGAHGTQCWVRNRIKHAFSVCILATIERLK